MYTRIARGSAGGCEARSPHAGVHRVVLSGAGVHWARPAVALGEGHPVSGFGLALPMLVDHGVLKHPWLTIELIEQELEIWNYQADPVAVFEDSLEEAE